MAMMKQKNISKLRLWETDSIHNFLLIHWERERELSPALNYWLSYHEPGSRLPRLVYAKFAGWTRTLGRLFSLPHDLLR